MKPKTAAERQAAYAARGRPINVVLTDPKAIAALDRLAKREGGIKAAVTCALHAASNRKSADH